MSDHVYWILTADINEGQMDNFKSFMSELVEVTKRDEPGALNYEWSISADNKTIHLFERYANSEATLIHMDNFGKNFAKRYMEIFTPKTFTLYGNPSEGVIKAVAPMQPRQLTPVGGFSR